MRCASGATSSGSKAAPPPQQGRGRARPLASPGCCPLSAERTPGSLVFRRSLALRQRRFTIATYGSDGQSLAPGCRVSLGCERHEGTKQNQVPCSLKTIFQRLASNFSSSCPLYLPLPNANVGCPPAAPHKLLPLPHASHRVSPYSSLIFFASSSRSLVRLIGLPFRQVNPSAAQEPVP